MYCFKIFSVISQEDLFFYFPIKLQSLFWFLLIKWRYIRRYKKVWKRFMIGWSFNQPPILVIVMILLNFVRLLYDMIKNITWLLRLSWLFLLLRVIICIIRWVWKGKWVVKVRGIVRRVILSEVLLRWNFLLIEELLNFLWVHSFSHLYSFNYYTFITYHFNVLQKD